MGAVMTKYERAKAIAKAEGLPEWQNEHMATVEDQLLTVGLNFYETDVKKVLGDGVPLITMTPDQANEQARAFGKILLVFALDVCHIRQKEKREAKRELSPTPPIEKREEKKEKATTTTTRVRARGRTGEIFPPTDEMVYAECKEMKIEQLFGKFFIREMKKEDWRHPTSRRKMYGWRKALAVWWSLEGTFKGRSRYADFKEACKVNPPRRVYTREDWQFCESCGCANFVGGRCKAGFKAPPNTDERGNHSPYYCEKYIAMEAAK